MGRTVQRSLSLIAALILLSTLLPAGTLHLDHSDLDPASAVQPAPPSLPIPANRQRRISGSGFLVHRIGALLALHGVLILHDALLVTEAKRILCVGSERRDTLETHPLI